MKKKSKRTKAIDVQEELAKTEIMLKTTRSMHLAACVSIVEFISNKVGQLENHVDVTVDENLSKSAREVLLSHLDLIKQIVTNSAAWEVGACQNNDWVVST